MSGGVAGGLRITGVRWTRAVNLFAVACPCGRRREHRADRFKVCCPACGRAGNSHRLPEDFSMATTTPPPAGLPVEPRPLMADARCRGCERRIFFAESVKSGKPVPLDPGVHMAVVFTGPDGVRRCQSAVDYWWDLCQLVSRGKLDEAGAKLLAMDGFALNHFQNCAAPGRFNLKGRIDEDHRRLMADALRRVADRLAGPGRTLGIEECREVSALCRAAADNKPAAAGGTP